MDQQFLYVLGFIPDEDSDFYDFLLTTTVEKAEKYKQEYSGTNEDFFKNRNWVVRKIPFEGDVKNFTKHIALTCVSGGTKVVKLGTEKDVIVFIDHFYPEGLLNGC